MKLLKNYTALFLGLLFNSHLLAQNLDKWAFTDFIYLAKPSYIFKVESKVTHLAGEADQKLQGLFYKVHETSFKKPTIYYHFEVQEVIYGEGKSTFHLNFSADELRDECDLTNDFNNHSDQSFWNGEGRSQVIEIRPHEKDLVTCFVMNNTYLIIRKGAALNQSYELINSDSDQWLEFVRNKVPEIEKMKIENQEWLEQSCNENRYDSDNKIRKLCKKPS